MQKDRDNCVLADTPKNARYPVNITRMRQMYGHTGTKDASDLSRYQALNHLATLIGQPHLQPFEPVCKA